MIGQHSSFDIYNLNGIIRLVDNQFYKLVFGYNNMSLINILQITLYILSDKILNTICC